MKCSLKHFSALLCLIWLLFANVPAYSQQRPIRLVSDSEIEALLRDYATPIFKAAGLDADAVNIYLVNDGNINAFVAGGQNVFFHTGLLRAAKTPDPLIGVLAHEVGHIAGGHLSRTGAELEKASITALAGYLLGAVAALGAGDGGAAAAVMTGGSQLAERSLLRYTRSQERAADQFAMTILQRLQISPAGLISILKQLEQRGLWRRDAIDPYAQSHPLTQERISFIERQLENLWPVKPHPDDWAMRHQLMLGKLRGFLAAPQITIQQISDNTNNIADLYALAIAHYRLPDVIKGDTLLNRLREITGESPYFTELQGQLYYEAGKAEEAKTFYKTALSALPRATLIRHGYAKTLLATNDWPQAERTLRVVVQETPYNTAAWRDLSIALGRQEKLGEAALALAEIAYQQRNEDELRFHLARAEERIDTTSSDWQRLQDLQKILEQEALFR